MSSTVCKSRKFYFVYSVYILYIFTSINKVANSISKIKVKKFGKCFPFKRLKIKIAQLMINENIIVLKYEICDIELAYLEGLGFDLIIVWTIDGPYS